VSVCPACDSAVDDAIPLAGLALHPGCQPLDIDPQQAATGLFTIISDAITNQPRSLQTRIGPSELGHPCDRRIGHKLAGTEPVNQRGVPYKPYVGTAIHEQFADIFARHEAHRDTPGTQRFHVEERVTVGDILGEAIAGSTDLFDAWYGIVWDWKFTSTSMIKKQYRPHGPGPQYRKQAHLYGRGWALLGHPVTHVAVVFFTRDGEFHDRYVWSEPYDEQIAIDTLNHVSEIKTGLNTLGPEFLLPILPTADAYCGNCPYFRVGATDLARACPGEGRVAIDTADPFK